MRNKMIMMGVLLGWLFARDHLRLEYAETLLAQLAARFRFFQNTPAHRTFFYRLPLCPLLEPCHIWRTSFVLHVRLLKLEQFE